MNRAERIYRLHQLLRGRRPVPLRRLMDTVGASRATVNRDLGYLRDFFRAPIVYDREHNGYRYNPTEPAFELPGLFFNESELFALLAAEQLLEAVQPGLLAPRLGPLRGRIRSLLAESGHRPETVAARIVIRQAARRTPDADLFGRIAEAVLSSRVLAFTYHGRARNQPTWRRVHGARLIHYRDNWYLLGWCEQAQALRLFALERIADPGITNEPTRLPPDRDLDRHLNASFGIFTGEAREWAVLRFTAEMARWISDETWHPDQIGQWRDGAYELQIPYSDPRELLMEILKYGPDVEVLAPATLRAAAVDRHRQALRQYRDS
ncbi:MAG TPA: WYL domain-containing protein [Nitrococcus sp.]|nr:WYL domain-containing protein [Nitrococcus sp.]